MLTNCLPYLRIAALLRHYVYNEKLPDIFEQDWGFTRLAQFLGMADEWLGQLCSLPGLAASPCRPRDGLDWRTGEFHQAVSAGPHQHHLLI